MNRRNLTRIINISCTKNVCVKEQQLHNNGLVRCRILLYSQAYRKKNMKSNKEDMFHPLLASDCSFIKPFVEKWQKQTLFSVLMRYRAIKFQEFYNMAQQVHFYNQLNFHNLMKNQDGVDIHSIETNANVSSWLGKVKPSVLKLRFRFDDIPYYDTSSMCDPLTNIGYSITRIKREDSFRPFCYSYLCDRTATDREEHWDTPYRWREVEALSKESESDENIDNGENLHNITYSRDPKEQIVELPPLDEDADYHERLDHPEKKKNTHPTTRRQINVAQDSAPFKNINLKKIEDTYRNNIDVENLINSSPANKDFQYIKATPISVKPKHSVDPIAELRNKGRRDSIKDDEPPFNFQGMLRKTNFRRESLKNAVDAVRRFSFTNDEKRGHVMTNGKTEDEAIYSKPVHLEIMPGLIMEGLEVDL